MMTFGFVLLARSFLRRAVLLSCSATSLILRGSEDAAPVRRSIAAPPLRAAGYRSVYGEKGQMACKPGLFPRRSPRRRRGDSPSWGVCRTPAPTYPDGNAETRCLPSVLLRWGCRAVSIAGAVVFLTARFT
jgi:hypothetical protein